MRRPALRASRGEARFRRTEESSLDRTYKCSDGSIGRTSGSKASPARHRSFLLSRRPPENPLRNNSRAPCAKNSPLADAFAFGHARNTKAAKDPCKIKAREHPDSMANYPSILNYDLSCKKSHNGSMSTL